MSAKVTLNQDDSNIMHEFFDGALSNLTKESLLRVYDNPDINRNREKISEKKYKYFSKIIKALKKKPDLRVIIKESTLKEESKEESKEEVFIKDQDKYVVFKERLLLIG